MTGIKEYVNILLDGCDFSKDYIKEIEKTETEGVIKKVYRKVRVSL